MEEKPDSSPKEQVRVQAGRPGMAAPLCTPARPLHLPSALLGSGPTQSQKETRLKVGWITVGGGGVGDTGNSRETRLCGRLCVALPPMAVPARAHSLFLIFPPKVVEPTRTADALSEQRPPPAPAPLQPCPSLSPAASSRPWGTSLLSPYLWRMGLPCSSGLSSAPCSWGSGTPP